MLEVTGESKNNRFSRVRIALLIADARYPSLRSGTGS
ncbi:hypothetical protein FHS01_005004 [Longimicrobium terrae]|uniref:Uncharacterized protein n=1 Tax=Longimicrobium terrae TaxID=1639882 RepID=A0A841H614_9BACT|nr:hypothetical protein [Longimicrobium terrae]MBB6073179.1 hypothetical protein [Longimicrobium terrae]